MFGFVGNFLRKAAHVSGKVLGSVGQGLKILGSASHATSKFLGSTGNHLGAAAMAIGAAAGHPELGKVVGVGLMHAGPILGAGASLATGVGGAVQGLSERLGSYGRK